jgi:signal peptidase I
MAVIAGMLASILLVSGCKAPPPIVDEATEYDLPVISQLEGNQFIYALESDGMVYKKQYSYRSQLVVDPDYYQTHEIMRGDVVYFETSASREDIDRMRNSAYDVVRVIGLPGETVQIKRGQIMIDDRKLGAFYGNESFALGGKLEPEKAVKMKKLHLPAGRYFLLGDLWWRNYNNSIRSGPIAKDRIRGKVIGWTGKIEGVDTGL